MNIKLLFLLGCCFSTILAIGQKNQHSYEQLILTECENESDNANCFYQIIETKVRQVLNEEIQTKIKKDTVYVWIALRVDKKGDLDGKCSVKVNTKKGTEIRDKMVNYISELEPFQVINAPDKPFVKHHYLEFKYLYNWKKEDKFSLIEPNTVYKGGVLYERPAYQGCNSNKPNKRTESLHEGVTNYIKENFLYINFIGKFNMDDELKINLVFGKDGKVQKISFDSIENELLLVEFKRILTSMPAIQPTKIDGQPQESKLSIPIILRG